MRKKYDITYDTLNGLWGLLSEYSDDAEVIRDMNKIKYLIRSFKNNFAETSNDNLFSRLQSDLDIYPMFKPYYVFADLFAETGLFLDVLNIEPKYHQIKFSNEKAYSEASAFLAMHGSFFREQLEEFDEDKFSNLKFTSPKANTDGGVIYLKTIGQAFVFSPNFIDFTKVTILVHELEHVIDCFNNPLLIENRIVREIVSVFMEMIASDYIASKYGLGNDNYQRRLFLHSIIKEQALVVRDKMDMLSIVQKNSNLSNDKLLDLLHAEGFSSDNLKYYCGKSLEEDFDYIIAQMVAIELYYIYRTDVEYALTIIKDIVLNSNDDNILDILAKYNIVLGEKISNYEHELVHNLKKGN